MKKDLGQHFLRWTPWGPAVCVRLIESQIKDTLGTCSMCPSYRESNKGSKERQGPTLSVRFTEVSIL